MALDYRYALDCAVVEHILLLPARQREQFVAIFRSLANDPFQRGDFTFRDPSTREIQVKLFGQWKISFWSDHPVKEVRIVGIQRARR
jgi:hypothetical protein